MHILLAIAGVCFVLYILWMGGRIVRFIIAG